jgi:hypothetical protein
MWFVGHLYAVGMRYPPVFHGLYLSSISLHFMLNMPTVYVCGEQFLMTTFIRICNR